MATFMTRVELHAADDDDYQTLHDAMEAEGFVRTITSEDGIKYHLPDAEYHRDANLTRGQVCDSAKRAASKTGKKFGVIVTQADEPIIWYNLLEVVTK
jgi:hypothetical protein